MKNPYAEAIGLLFSGKSFKPVLVKIAQNNPGVLVKAFNDCYPPVDQAGPLEKTMADEPKFDAVIAKEARSNFLNGIKYHRAIYRTSLKEAKEAVKKMLAEDRVKS